MVCEVRGAGQTQRGVSYYEDIPAEANGRVSDDIAKICIRCGYALDNLPVPRCPECGQPFDPANSGTFTRPDELFTWRHWAQPPPAWNIAAIVVIACLVVYSASTPVHDLTLMTCVGPVFAFALVVDFLVRVGAALFAKQNALPQESYASPRRKGRWLVLPAFILLLASVHATEWPLRMRFGFSRPAFERVLLGLQTGTHTNCGAQRIGLYAVERIEGIPTNCRFMTGFNWVDPVGFTYDPAFSGSGSRTRVRVAPGWFTYEE